MSNIVKSFFASSNAEARVIDYNELIQEKIKIAEVTRREAQTLQVSEEDSAEEFSEDGFVAGLTAPIVEIPEIDPIQLQEQAQATADNIIAQANSEAERILRNAKKEADAMWEKAYAEAKKNGFDAGVKEGRTEVDRMRNEFLKEKKQQQNEYVELLESMESDLVEVILEVFEKVTRILSTDKKDIMLHLIDNALNHIESSKEFVIRVSKDDYQSVAKHKEALLGMIPQSGSLEIVKDATLEKNQCLIETDGGIFDCGLDAQLENLMLDIKALSCM